MIVIIRICHYHSEKFNFLSNLESKKKKKKKNPPFMNCPIASRTQPPTSTSTLISSYDRSNANQAALSGRKLEESQVARLIIIETGTRNVPS